MGCFVGCFGVCKKKKHSRKTYNRVLVKDIIRGSYEQLDTTAALLHENAEDSGCSETEYRDKFNNELKSKIRKRVTFNLNVQVFEPVSTDYHLLENEDDEGEKESVGAEVQNEALLCDLPSAGHNYRYQNCSDGYDEDDELVYDDCDFDEDIDDEIVEEEYHDCVSESVEDFSEKFGSVSLESHKDSAKGQLEISKEHSGSDVPHCQSNSAEPKAINESARDRSRYVHSVLSPIENLTQWKVVKREVPAAAASRSQRKENCAVEKGLDLDFNPRSTCKSCLNQSNNPQKNVAVDASLSNWLA